jgi:hypothetical protein
LPGSLPPGRDEARMLCDYRRVVANWAVVVGIDRYWSEAANLRGAVRDALSVREWLLDPAGGNVPAENLQLVLAPGPNSPPLDPALEQLPVGTKANITVAINNLIQLSGGTGERLFFFYAGHGLTARISNRDESALLATDFTSVNTDNSIALRSLWEFFETTQFDDQFFFVDACRNVPPWGEGAEFELGRWTLSRTRDPGMRPVQQFILYATSPKLKATEVRDVPGEEHGAFTAAVLDGLRGAGAAKAWSWQRNAYEVRWERLADYVKRRIEGEQRKVGESAEGAALLQIPQDTGSRGVADRDRDAVLTSFAAGAFPKERLEVLLDPDTAYPVADVRVLDSLGDVVAGQVGVAGTSIVFDLRPGTYALRATAPEIGAGRVLAPIELYGPLPEPPKITLQPLEAPVETVADAPAALVEAAVEAPVPPADAAAPAAARGIESQSPGRIPLEAPDPLSIVEVRDETGSVVEVGRARANLELPPGFYHVRHVGPEATTGEGSIALASGETEEPVKLQGSEPSPATLELLAAMGGKEGPGNTIELDGHEPVAWAQTSTLVALALGSKLTGEDGAAGLDLRPPRASEGSENGSGLAVYVVSETEEIDIGSIEIRVWKSGTPVPESPEEVRKVAPRLAELSVANEPGRYWLSILRRGEGRPMVFAPTVLRGRVATIVVQITAGIRLFQYQPATEGGSAAAPGILRRVEYLQRLLLSGRLDGARELALELAETDDPFVGCLCGYVLLRLGLMEDLKKVSEWVIQAAPQLSDGFVLRGEYAAATGDTAAKLAFAEAISAGVPLFGEGLTRLLEGLRAHDITHPRSAIVRYVFQNHMRGSMWSVFTPQRFEPGKLVVTAADTGYEA